MQKSQHSRIFTNLSDALQSGAANDPRGKSISQEQISTALRELKAAASKYRSVLRERSKITKRATESFISQI